MAISMNNIYQGINYMGDSSSLASVANAEKLSGTIKSASNDDETMKACEEFEAYLLQKMFQSMEETAKVFSDDKDNDSTGYVEMFSDNMYQAIAENMMSSGQSLGIAKTLYDSIKQNEQGQIVTE